MEVWADIDVAHLPHTSHGLLSSEASKVADQPLRKLHSLKWARL